jgi:tetratricopeptide (TPR) repeat protein
LLLLLFVLLSCDIFFVAHAASFPQGPSPSAKFEAFAKSAAAAREAGNPDQAIADYRQALELRPNWPEGWWYLGTLQYDRDHYREAIPAFQKLVELSPDAGAAWSFLGLCEFETNNYADSFQHLEKGNALGSADDPEIAKVSQFHFALLLVRDGQFERASALLASTFANRQIPAEAKSALGLALLRVPLLPQESDPSKDSLIHGAAEAAALMLQGDSPSALDKFATLSKQFPSTPYLHYTYGLALASAGHVPEAITQQRAEVLLSPDSSLPLIEISRLELRLNRSDQALRDAQDAVRLDPNSPAAHELLSQNLALAGKKELSQEELRIARSLAPEKLGREARILSLYSAPSPLNLNPDRAPADAAKATADPAHLAELARRAAALQADGQPDAAIQIYQQGLATSPQWDEGQWNLAMLYYSAKKYREAVATLKDWLQRKPSDGTAWAVMGLAEFATRDYENARIHLQRGSDLGFGGSPESVLVAKYTLAVLKNQHGQFDGATRLLVTQPVLSPLADNIHIALGMALLRIPQFPEQLDPAKVTLVRSAGEISILLYKSKYDEAFPKLTNLLKEFPATPMLHYVYGSALESLSEYDQAELQMREERRLSPENALPYIGLASIALRRRRPADGLPSAQRAVELAPQSAEAHYILGRIYLEQGSDAVSLKELEKASSLAPESPQIHFNLARAYAKASLPEKAAEQRAIFARLNALAERQRSLLGDQSYAGPHGEAGPSAAPIEPN